MVGGNENQAVEHQAGNAEKPQLHILLKLSKKTIPTPHEKSYLLKKLRKKEKNSLTIYIDNNYN